MSSAPNQFFCDSCHTIIELIQPRIHCLICPNFDLCANCAVAEKFLPNHLAGHAIRVYKQSGHTLGGTVLSQVVITYNTDIESNSPTGHPINGTGLSQRPPPPLPPRPNIPPSHTVVISNAYPDDASAAKPGWQPFFNPDCTPTSIFLTLANEIFTHLDPHGLGVLLPETLSQFLDDLGYSLEQNYWKKGWPAFIQQTSDPQILAARDKYMKNIFDLFTIDHQIFQRSQPGLKTSPLPAITPKGFIDIAAIDLLCDPSQHWDNLLRLIQRYHLPVYQRWGLPPRSVLPLVPQQAMLDRLDAARNATKRCAEERAALQVAQAAGLVGLQAGVLQLMSGHRVGSLV